MTRLRTLFESQDVLDAVGRFGTAYRFRNLELLKKRMVRPHAPSNVIFDELQTTKD